MSQTKADQSQKQCRKCGQRFEKSPTDSTVNCPACRKASKTPTYTAADRKAERNFAARQIARNERAAKRRTTTDQRMDK